MCLLPACFTNISRFMIGEALIGPPSSPVFVHELADMHVPDGSPACFECVVHGNPKPNITWYRESFLVEPSDEFVQSYDENNACSLHIKEVFPEDEGTYTVVAKNSQGTSISAAELVVVEGEDLNRLFSQCHSVNIQPDVPSQCSAQVFKRAGCHLKRAL